MNRLILIVLIVGGFLVTGCGVQDIYNVQNATVPQVAGSKHSLADVTAAIMRSSGDPKVLYIMEYIKPGLIKCELNYKSAHKAWMDITYSTEGYSITYVKSEKLRYVEATEDRPWESISGHYNNWIRALNNSIRENLAKGPSAKTMTNDPKERMLELKKLRDSNLITEEEFQAQRTRILNKL